MADSLGEVFVDVIANTADFGSGLESGVSDALASISGSVEGAFDGIPGLADDAFSGVVGSADGAAEEIGSTFERMSDAISENLGKIAVGGAVAGASMEAFARKERDTTVEARFLARQLGTTEGEMLDLISSTSNATFPLEDVTALMRTAAQRGLEGEDSLVNFANFWDMIGDATGESATSLGESSVALAALGIEVGNEAEALDAFGFIMDNTTQGVGDFLRFVERTGPQLNDLGLDIDQTAGLLGAMEQELGLSGRMARTEFRKAVGEADGDLGAMLETLGLSADTLDRYTDQVKGSGGAISDNADIFADARTPVENMTAAIRAQLFRYPQLGEAAGALAAPLTALGPAAMGFTQGAQALSMISGGVTKALGVLRVGFVKLGAVILANPIFLIGALLIGVAVLVWKFRDEIVEALVGAWEWIKEKVGALVDWFRTAIPDAISAVVDWVKENWPLILAIITGPIGLAVKFIVDNWDRIKQAVSDAVQAVRDFVRRGFERLRDTVKTLIERVRDLVVNAFNALRDRARSAVESLRDSVRTTLDTVVGFVRDLPGRVLSGIGNLGSLLYNKGRDMIQGLLDGARSLLRNIGSFFLDVVPGWIRGPFERALGISSPSKVFADLGRDTLAGYRVGLEDEFRRVERLLGEMGGDIPVAVRAEQLAGQGPVGTGGRGGQGMTVSVTVNNPTPERASESISREMRRLAFTGVFDD